MSDLTHLMSTIDLVTINVEIPRIDSGCSFGKDFNKLIYINLSNFFTPKSQSR